MSFYIIESETKREVKGSPKQIILSTRRFKGNLVNRFDFGDEYFKRPIKKVYTVMLYRSYRKDGKVVRKRHYIANLNYYKIAEAYVNEIIGFDEFYYQLLERLDSVIHGWGISDDEREELQDSLAEKLDPLFERIGEDFLKTEEGKVLVERKKLLQKYERDRRKFMNDYDAWAIDYDICFDLYGNKTNPEYLQEIMKRGNNEKG